MTRESLITIKLFINAADQICHFQIKLPRAVNRIIGIETGLILNTGDLPSLFVVRPSPFVYQRKVVFGELRLKTLDSANIFYTHELSIDPNIKYADFDNPRFRSKVFTHQIQRHEDQINLDGSVTLIQGFYKNTIQSAIPYSYTAQVYVWIEAKEENDK